MTGRGEVSVEDLAAGDQVVTADGQEKEVIWIGRADYRSNGGHWHEDECPIRFRPSSIADGVPSRDLYLSPWHFVHIDGVLIPARDLVNDVSIVAEAPVGATTLEYFHVLLDSHALLRAEGVEAESLLFNAAPEEFFSDFADVTQLGLGNDIVGKMEPCLPRVWYSGGRSHLAALARLGISTIVDVRDPIQRANARLAQRATAVVRLAA